MSRNTDQPPKSNYSPPLLPENGQWVLSHHQGWKNETKNIDAWAIRASGDDCHLRERSDRLTDRLGIRKTKSKSHLPRCCFFLGAPSLRLFIYAGKMGKRVLTPFFRDLLTTLNVQMNRRIELRCLCQKSEVDFSR